MAYNFGCDHKLGFMTGHATGCAPLLEEVTSQVFWSGEFVNYALQLARNADLPSCMRRL